MRRPFFRRHYREIFSAGWLELLPDDATRQRMRRTLAAIIDRERRHIDFDVSIKATIVIGQK
jgi:hypothetical protein